MRCYYFYVGCCFMRQAKMFWLFLIFMILFILWVIFVDVHIDSTCVKLFISLELHHIYTNWQGFDIRYSRKRFPALAVSFCHVVYLSQRMHILFWQTGIYGIGIRILVPLKICGDNLNLHFQTKVNNSKKGNRFIPAALFLWNRCA